jgi:hypothetical protein
LVHACLLWVVLFCMAYWRVWGEPVFVGVFVYKNHGAHIFGYQKSDAENSARVFITQIP